MIYGLFAMVLGTVVNLFLTEYDTKHDIEKQTTLTILSEICIELGIIAVLAFYIRMIVQAIPSPWHIFPVAGYKPYAIPEYAGEMAIAFLHLATDSSLVEKVRILSRRFSDNVLLTGKWSLSSFFQFDEKTPAPAPKKEQSGENAENFTDTPQTPKKRVTFAPDALKPQIQMKTEASMDPRDRLEHQFNNANRSGLDMLGSAEQTHHPLSMGASAGMGATLENWESPLQGSITPSMGMGMGTQAYATNDLRSQLANQNGGNFPAFMDGIPQI